MSAMGRNGHCAIADQCPLYLRKQSFAPMMSALCQKRTFCASLADGLNDARFGPRRFEQNPLRVGEVMAGLWPIGTRRERPETHVNRNGSLFRLVRPKRPARPG